MASHQFKSNPTSRSDGHYVKKESSKKTTHEFFKLWKEIDVASDNLLRNVSIEFNQLSEGKVKYHIQLFRNASNLTHGLRKQEVFLACDLSVEFDASLISNNLGNVQVSKVEVSTKDPLLVNCLRKWVESHCNFTTKLLTPIDEVVESLKSILMIDLGPLSKWIFEALKGCVEQGKLEISYEPDNIEVNLLELRLPNREALKLLPNYSLKLEHELSPLRLLLTREIEERNVEKERLKVEFINREFDKSCERALTIYSRSSLKEKERFYECLKSDVSMQVEGNENQSQGRLSLSLDPIKSEPNKVWKNSDFCCRIPYTYTSFKGFSDVKVFLKKVRNSPINSLIDEHLSDHTAECFKKWLNSNNVELKDLRDTLSCIDLWFNLKLVTFYDENDQVDIRNELESQGVVANLDKLKDDFLKHLDLDLEKRKDQPNLKEVMVIRLMKSYRNLEDTEDEHSFQTLDNKSLEDERSMTFLSVQRFLINVFLLSTRNFYRLNVNSRIIKVSVVLLVVFPLWFCVFQPYQFKLMYLFLSGLTIYQLFPKFYLPITLQFWEFLFKKLSLEQQEELFKFMKENQLKVSKDDFIRKIFWIEDQSKVSLEIVEKRLENFKELSVEERLENAKNWMILKGTENKEIVVLKSTYYNPQNPLESILANAEKISPDSLIVMISGFTYNFIASKPYGQENYVHKNLNNKIAKYRDMSLSKGQANLAVNGTWYYNLFLHSVQLFVIIILVFVLIIQLYSQDRYREGLSFSSSPNYLVY